MLLNFIKKITPSFFKRNINSLIRVLDVFFMYICLHFENKNIYKFSTRKFLPKPKYKYNIHNKPKIPYNLLKSKSNNIKKFKKINVVGISPNFNLNKIKKFKEPTFLVSFFETLKITSDGTIFYKTDPKIFGNLNCRTSNLSKAKEFKKKNLFYVTAEPKLIKLFSKKGHKTIVLNTYKQEKYNKFKAIGKRWRSKYFLKLIKKYKCKRISIVENFFKVQDGKNFPSWAQTGSFLPSLCALSFFSQRINVYGWDFFLDKSAKTMTYFELLAKMYIHQADIKRSLSHFEEALYNFYFANQLSKQKKFQIFSNLGSINYQKKLIKKIERVFYK